MVIADKTARLRAGIHHADTVAAMRAGIQERLYRTVALAHDDHVIFAHRGADEIAGTGDLAFMGQKQPGTGKDLLQLGLIDRLVHEEAAIHLRVLAVHELGVFGIACGLGIDRRHVRAAAGPALASSITHVRVLL